MIDASADELPDRALGRRVGGAVLDMILLGALLFPFAAVLGQASARSGQISVHLEGSGTAGYTGLCLLYFVLCELLAGASVGKMLVGVRVATEEGGRPAPWQVIVRNLLRPIDFLPVVYLIGYLVAMASGPSRRQRIGDRVARTLVVPRSALGHPKGELAGGG
ncbi:MAG: hypothetical protein QOK40_548 [Miltoncostaeaceae bacterium]|nr:hypothetical protein [Miltoncostaeaceae bacterium]